MLTSPNNTAPAVAASVSNLHIPQLATTIAINLPPNSNDINFYMTAPTYYSYVALGFGSQMANSFMLVAYPAEDGRRKSLSHTHARTHTRTHIHSLLTPSSLHLIHIVIVPNRSRHEH